MFKPRWIVAAVAVTLALVHASLGGPAAHAQDVCVSIQGVTKTQSGSASCASDATSRSIAVNGSTATATTGSTATAINNSTAIGHFGSRVTATNGSTATANTEAVRDDCRVTATNGATESCP